MSNTEDLAQKAWHRRMANLMDEMPALRTDISWLKEEIKGLRDSIGVLHEKINSTKTELHNETAAVQQQSITSRADINSRAQEMAIKMESHLSNHKVAWSVVIGISVILTIIQVILAISSGGSGHG